MKGWRIACVVLVCLVCTLGMVACSTVSYSVQVKTGGARTLTFMVQFDDTTTDEERAMAEAFLRNVADNRNQNGRACEIRTGSEYVAMVEQFESATDYYIAMGYTGDEPNEEETPMVNLNAYFNEYRSTMTLADRATVVAYALQYAVSQDVQILFLWQSYCMGGATMVGDELQPVYRQLAFTSADMLLTETCIALDGEYGEKLAVVLQTWLADKGYDIQAVPFRYTYEHVYRSVYAADCTRTYTNTETGATVYQWDMALADVPDAQLIICQKAPRVWAWELTAVGVGLLVAAIVMTIILVRRRKMQNAAREE